MLYAIGGGLIGAGAFLLLTTLWWPRPSRELMGIAAQERIRRNTDVATVVSAVLTFGGAVLLLVPSDWLSALLGVGIGAALFYVALAGWTRRAWLEIKRQIVLEREQLDGRITMYTANRIGLQNDPTAAEFEMIPIAMNEPALAEHALRIAERNSSWRWALRHPRGGGPGRVKL